MVHAQPPHTQTHESLARRLRHLFLKIYPSHDSETLINQTFAALGIQRDPLGHIPAEHLRKWSEKDTFLITYGNSVKKEKEAGLKTLNQFFKDHLADTFNAIHVLPFHPFTSDDGFAVSDFTAIRPELGNWQDLKNLADSARIMGDLVINHISSEHLWFKQFLDDAEPGKRYVLEAPPDFDTSEVVRPRSHPLIQIFETQQGETRQVWCTFSRDQVDLDFRDPDLFLEMLKLIHFFGKNGIEVIRLDAVGFLWKESGSSCINLPQTHAVVQALRCAINAVLPQMLFITETNVPLKENLSYFGEQDEAHMIYNFSLAPMLAQSILSGNCRPLRKCLTGMPAAPAGCTYFNFTASHDGIGLRPAESLLNDDELNALIEHSNKMGGRVSFRKMQNGDLKPYELNTTLASLFRENLAGENQMGIERLILCQAVAMAIEGIPAIYIQSIFACPNDHTGFEKSGIARRLNRKQWDFDEAVHRITEDPVGTSAFNQLSTLLNIRQGQPAFHPNATQYTLNLGPHVLGIWRESLLKDQNIFCIFNFTAETQTFHLEELNLISTQNWLDLITSKPIEDLSSAMTLAPYQIAWIANKDGRLASTSALLKTYQSLMPL